ncbi:hypothetical protein ACFS5N_11290 [Mucilaginibacter ximonensis]|uniref:Outer membrane protein beta-barrel domain-containing protein n=1 Tax=Mucilaginibacter ximonensis TaxID=538021 RepID=A0ABW5YCQ2_9SPHI
MKKEKSIDDIFRSALEDPANEPAFREGDWDNFENMLDEGKRGGKVFWLPILGSVAAVLLAFIGWWIFKPQAGTAVQQTQQVATNKTTKTEAPAVTVQPQQAATAGQTETRIATTVKPANTAAIEKTTTQQTKAQQQYLAGANKANGSTATPQLVKKQQLNAPAFNNNLTAVDTAKPYLAMVPVKADAVTIDQTQGVSTPELSRQSKTGIDAVAIVLPKPKIKATTAGTGFRPQYTLGFLAAPEVNGVGSFNSTSSGTNVGLLFTVGLNRFSASTGATYSTKPYSLPFSSYHTAYQFKTNPQSVTADCRVLDIPINIGYQLYNKSLNKISIGTGISSYIMMHESYAYDYGNDPYPGPTSYTVKGKGKYFFSIMNLQASYERKVASNIGLSVTPYLKLPLSDIGYSQVKVQTFGVAVGLNWNINSLTKPK